MCVGGGGGGGGEIQLASYRLGGASAKYVDGVCMLYLICAWATIQQQSLDTTFTSYRVFNFQ